MNYTQDLVSRLKLTDVVSPLGNAFNIFYSNQPKLKIPVDVLRRIKAFIHDGRPIYYSLLEQTNLNSTDCLTLAVIGNILAQQQNVETKIVSPRGIRFLHSALSYLDEKSQERIFKLSGSQNRVYTPADCTILTSERVEARINLFRPLVNFANRFRKKGKSKHYYSVFCQSSKSDPNRN